MARVQTCGKYLSIDIFAPTDAYSGATVFSRRHSCFVAALGVRYFAQEAMGTTRRKDAYHGLAEYFVS
jgi:hypothetical protein